MRLKIYYDYLKYILEHKKNVFIECWKEGLYLHAFTHDLSKFNRDKEFYAYAEWFYGEYGIKYKGDFSNKQKMCKQRFENAWKHHYRHNKHHWNYWTIISTIDDYELFRPKEMPIKYIKQMLCDWKAMSRKFGDTAQEFYLKNYKKIKLYRNSRHLVEILLGIAYEGLDDAMNYSTIEEIVDDCLNYEKRNPNTFDRNWFYDEYLAQFKNKYNINILEILGKVRNENV